MDKVDPSCYECQGEVPWQGKARQAASISVFYDLEVYCYLGTLTTVNF